MNQEKTHHTDYDVMIVGGGPAGIAAAIEGSRQGFKVLIIEQSEYFGGQEVTGVFLSKGASRTQNIKKFIEEEYPAFQKEYHQKIKSLFKELGIDSLHGRASLDKGKISVTKHEETDSKNIQRSENTKIIWATGSQPRRPENTKDFENIFDSSNVAELFKSLIKNPEQNIAIIGGGVTATEYAFALAKQFPLSEFKLISKGNVYEKIPKFLQGKVKQPDNLKFINEKACNYEQISENITIKDEQDMEIYKSDKVLLGIGKEPTDNHAPRPENYIKEFWKQDQNYEYITYLGDALTNLVAEARYSFQSFCAQQQPDSKPKFDIPGISYFPEKEYATIGNITPEKTVLEFEIDNKEGAIQFFLDNNNNLQGVGIVSKSASTFIHVFQWYIGKPIHEFMLSPFIQSEFGKSIQSSCKELIKIDDEEKKPYKQKIVEKGNKIESNIFLLPFAEINGKEAPYMEVSISNKTIVALTCYSTGRETLQDITNHFIGKTIEEIYAHPFASPSYAEAFREIAIKLFIQDRKSV